MVACLFVMLAVAIGVHVDDGMRTALNTYLAIAVVVSAYVVFIINLIRL